MDLSDFLTICSFHTRPIKVQQSISGDFQAITHPRQGLHKDLLQSCTTRTRINWNHKLILTGIYPSKYFLHNVILMSILHTAIKTGIYTRKQNCTSQSMCTLVTPVTNLDHPPNSAYSFWSPTSIFKPTACFPKGLIFSKNPKMECP